MSGNDRKATYGEVRDRHFNIRRAAMAVELVNRAAIVEGDTFEERNADAGEASRFLAASIMHELEEIDGIFIENRAILPAAGKTGEQSC
jgi:hypothetical protein